MKRKFWFVLSSALFLAAVPMAIASSDAGSVNEVMIQDEVSFASVDLADVPEVITKAAGKEHPGAEVKKAEVATVAGQKVYKLTVISADGNKTIQLYNSDGSAYDAMD